MATTVTAYDLRKQKEQCLHIIDIEKALTRLEDNPDFKAVCNFLFEENLLNNSKYAYSIHVNEEARKGSLKLAKALSRTQEYMESIHAVAKNCAEQLPELDKAIIDEEAEV